MTENHDVLFLCTGNYYRSRFAETLFNTRAIEAGIPWRASSRGLATEVIGPEYGPISPLALKGLDERGIQIGDEVRYPIQLSEADLLEAERIIALDEDEHWPMLARRYPSWEERVEYWRVPDLHRVSAEEALEAIEGKVTELIKEIGLKRRSRE
jgi:protein-tyrosine phosphatase